MSNKDHKRKKNRAERKQYKNSLGERGTGIDSTYEYLSGMLSGSDSFFDRRDEIPQQDDNEPVEKKTIFASIRDWIKNNAIETLISIIGISVVTWLVANMIEVQKEQAINEYRLEQIEEDIDNLSNSIPNKESLQIELDNLKESIDDLEAQELENRIEELEQSVGQYE